MKKAISVFLAICICISALSVIDSSVLWAFAATTPENVNSPTALSRINTLVDKLAGKYFTTDQKPDYGSYNDNHEYSCGEQCHNIYVIQSTWFKNTIMVPDNWDYMPYQYFENGYGANNGWSCFGFACYAQWYIFAQKSTDNIVGLKAAQSTFSRDFIQNNVHPGDIVRVGGHSMIFISSDTNTFTVLDNNWNNDNKIQKHSVSWSFYNGKTCYISRPKNSTPSGSNTPVHTHSYNEGYEAVHPHRKYMMCSCGEYYYTGEYATVESCDLCCNEHLPEMPYFNDLNSFYESGETITLKWNPTNNTTHYNIWIIKYNESTNEYNGDREWIPYAENGLTKTLTDGKYRLLLQSYNSNYFFPDHSDWLYTQNEAYIVVGSAALPEKPYFNDLKAYYDSGETITLQWSPTANTTHYNIWIMKYNDSTNEYDDREWIPYAESGLTKKLTDGKYRLELQSYNSNHFYSDHSDWLHTQNEEYIIVGPETLYNECVSRRIYNGHIYEVFNYETSWKNAKACAEDLGGHLVTITSDEEQRAIAKMIPEIWGVWIGATDEKDEGNWQWVTNEQFSYTNWNSDEPNNTDNNENYAHMIGTKDCLWNDTNGSVKLGGFVVEYEPKLITTITEKGHIYEFYEGKTNWNAAKEFAEAKEGHLITITSEEEQKIIHDNNTIGNCWLGASDKEEEGIWQWITGESFSFSNWSEGQPDNYNEKEHYAHIYGDTSYWNDYPIIAQPIKGFIVEYDNPCPNGHTWNTGEITTTPTCKDEGVKTYTCTVCGETRTETIAKTEDHVWDAGEITTAPTYTAPGEKTFTCAVCGETKTETIDPLPQPDEPDAVITVAKVNAQPGKTVDVTVDLTEYAPMSYLLLGLAYDKTVLTLDNVTNGGLFDTFENGANLLLSAGEDISAAGNILTLTFTVDENAEAGEYPVTVICRQCYNNEEETLAVKVENGVITVIDVLIGDVNGDSVIDGRDLIRLRKYLANLDEETGESTVEITAGADCTGDGVIDGRDLIRLRKYLANLDEETGVSTVTLG